MELKEIREHYNEEMERKILDIRNWNDNYYLDDYHDDQEYNIHYDNQGNPRELCFN